MFPEIKKAFLSSISKRSPKNKIVCQYLHPVYLRVKFHWVERGGDGNCKKKPAKKILIASVE